MFAVASSGVQEVDPTKCNLARPLFLMCFTWLVWRFKSLIIFPARFAMRGGCGFGLYFCRDRLGSRIMRARAGACRVWVGAGFPLFWIVCDGWWASENDFLALIFYLASFFIRKNHFSNFARLEYFWRFARRFYSNWYMYCCYNEQDRFLVQCFFSSRKSIFCWCKGEISYFLPQVIEWLANFDEVIQL